MNINNKWLTSAELFKQKYQALKAWSVKLSISQQILPILTIIQIGHSQASCKYINNKIKLCRRLKIKYRLIVLSVSRSTQEIINCIQTENNDKQVVGIIVQLPLPSHLKTYKIINTIDPQKDIDGFTAYWQGRIALGYNRLILGATPQGILDLIAFYKIDLKHKSVVILNNTIVVGQPLSQYLQSCNITVASLNHTTLDLSIWTRLADVIISATGQKHLISASDIKKGSILIDVGNCYEKQKLYGDIAKNPQVLEKCSMITPVPKGVGPLTVICLIENFKKLYEWNH